MVSEQQLNDDEAERIIRFVFKLRGEGDYPSAKAWERELLRKSRRRVARGFLALSC